MNAIWRPTQTTDLGIDGQIEFLETDRVISTGKIIAVQVKSGGSYFKNATDQYVPFYPKLTHRRYWQTLRLPVLLILHDPKRKVTLYESVKPQLAVGGPIKVSTSNTFTPEARDAVIAIHDSEIALQTRRITEPALESFRELILRPISSGHPGYRADATAISGIHFLLSAVNPEDGYPGGPYFELRGQRLEAAILAAGGAPLREYEHWLDFVVRCLEKCWAWGLTESFARDFDFWRYDLSMLLDRTAELTIEGHAVSTSLLSNAKQFLEIPSGMKSKFKSARAFARHIIRAAETTSERLDRSDRVGDYIF
jgi:hypothetical protein